jgi:outer membrane protein assembly factor BamB
MLASPSCLSGRDKHDFGALQRLCACLTLVLAAGSPIGEFASVNCAVAGEWPQILGPERNGVAVGEQLATSWPAAGPKVVWEHPVGAGFAGPAVATDPRDGIRRLLIFHRQKSEAVAEALDALSGKPLWRAAFPTNYTASIVNDDGPRCVPLLHAGAVYLFGAEGSVHCLDLVTGKVRWSRSLAEEFSAPLGYFGCGSSPLVEGDRLLINLGAPRGAGLVALALADGKLRWKATDEAASYSSPVATTIDGQRQAIFVTRLNVVGVDPADGRVLYRVPFGKRGPTVNAANPLLVGRDVFVTANYGVGARLLRLGRASADEVWSSDDSLSSQFTTPLLADGVLYGVDGRQDVGVARMRAIRPSDGKPLWTQENFGAATLMFADGKLLALGVNGTLKLIQPSPTAYRELASASLFNSTTQALPALADGMFYARDEARLKCFDLGKAGGNSKSTTSGR